MIRLLPLLLIPFLLKADVVSDFKTQIVKNETIDISQALENGDFNYYLFLIEYGNEKAINLAPDVLRFTDAAMTESVYISLARSLVKNPRAVLALTDVSVQNTCFVPFIEAPADIENIHIEQVVNTLSSLSFHDQDIELKRTLCLDKFKRLTIPAQDSSM